MKIVSSQPSLPSNRNFGITIGLVLLTISIYLLYFNSVNLNALWILSFIFFILGLFNSRILYPLNFVWFKLGIILGKIISPIFLFTFFIIIFTPYGIFGRIFSRDIKKIRQKKPNEFNSYWEVSNKTNNYEKQY